MMTRIKVKGAVKSKSLGKFPTDQVSQSPQRLQTGNAYFEDGVIPIIRGENKRKRAPRTGTRRVKQKHPFLFGEVLAESTGDLNEDHGSNSNSSDGKEQELEPKEHEVVQDNRKDNTFAATKTDTAQRNLMDSMNGVYDIPQKRGSLRLKVRSSKLREPPSPLAEKPSGFEDPGRCIDAVAPIRKHNAIPGHVKDHSKSAGRSVDKRQDKNMGAQEGPGSSKETVCKKDILTGRQEIEKHAAIQTKKTQGGGRENLKVGVNQTKDTPAGGLEGQKAPPTQPKDTEDGGRENKKFNAKLCKAKHSVQANFNESELKAALTVIKKIMKMEAAEPFNSPVDPVALGIPDYFDVIDTPMDLGTICQTLEKGQTYRNSRDVYEDVQLIWTNCRKYNNKGDPILELLNRVKKNFMKYWTAAGLYTEKAAALVEQVTVESKARVVKWQSEDVDTVRSYTPLEVETGQFEHNEDTAKPHVFVSGEKVHGIKHKKRKHKDRREQLEEVTDGKDALQLVLEDSKDEEIVVEASKVHAEIPVAEPEQNGGEAQEKLDNHFSDERPRSKKDLEVQNTPSKARRVSGTGHHKSDCSCVVCTGVRRKLAREGKLATPESGEAKPGAFTETETEEDSVGKHDNQLPGELNKDLIKTGIEDETKGHFDDTEDRVNIIHSEEHFGETIDADTEQQEGGMVRYYRASYEIPLRRVNTSILHMGQILFGGRSGSPWSRAHSLICRSTRDCAENPLLTGITLFLSSKKFPGRR